MCYYYDLQNKKSSKCMVTSLVLCIEYYYYKHGEGKMYMYYR